jgi:hypothetical protein
VNVDFIASRFHGALAAGHLFAAYYNIRKRNYLDAFIHGAFCLYDTASAVKHDRQSRIDLISNLTEEQLDGRWTEDFTG